MVDRWDTIIIGAGIGGLTAAATLVRAGQRVLVLDRNPHPGGTAYVYHRKGFSFPMGPLGFSQSRLVKDTLQYLGENKEVKLDRVRYRIKAYDLDIPLSPSIDEMAVSLSTLFPSDAGSLRTFFNHVTINPSGSTVPMVNGCEADGVSNFAGPASDYLDREIKDWRLRRILGSIGTREPYSNLTLLAAMWNLMCQEGIWFPADGMKAFCDRFVMAVTQQPRALSDRGSEGDGSGKISLNSEVSRIQVERGKVEGVILKDGTQRIAGSVISNADFKATFTKLLDNRVVPPEWYRAISGARQTGSIFQVSLGVNSRKTDLSCFKESDRIIYKRHPSNDQNLDWESLELVPDTFSAQELEVSLWGKNDLSSAPTDGEVIVIRTEAEYLHFARYRSPTERRTPSYQAYKVRLARALIREIESLLPGIEEAILVMDIATPLTFEDQGGRSEGAIAGWSWDYKDFRDNEPKELIQTPIKGLYMAGYQAFSALFMGGVPTAMESGKRAARAVLEGAPPAEKFLFPGAK